MRVKRDGNLSLVARARWVGGGGVVSDSPKIFLGLHQHNIHWISPANPPLLLIVYLSSRKKNEQVCD